VAEWVRDRTCDEVLAELGPGGAELPCAVVARADELLEDPQLVARGMIDRQPHPAIGEIVFHGNPLKLSDTEARERALAPNLAEHNQDVYSEIGLTCADLERLTEAGVI
jgi:crotonobetainyl-CoA:carnitine CoA-transferase CaiB-like acyl-CoA transferase